MLVAKESDGRYGFWELTADAEYRRLGYHGYDTLAVHPGGRLLAAHRGGSANQGGGTGIVDVWDLSDDRLLASVPAPSTRYLFFDPAGDLWMNSRSGVVRWPVRADGPPGAGIRLGPPHPESIPGSFDGFARSRDGRVVAVSRYGEGAIVWRADRPGQLLPLRPHRDVRFVDVSPDGRWVATGRHGGNDVSVKVWDVGDGRPVKEWDFGVSSTVKFSPDGRWLVTSGGGCRLWEVGSWRAGPTVGGEGLGFSPNGRILVVEAGTGVLRLVDPASGRDLARLEDPAQARAERMAFTPDGTRLIVVGVDSGLIHVWDLRAIRRRLAAMGLDWDAPPYPEPDPAESSPPPLTLAVLDSSEKAVEHLDARLKADPDDIEAHHERGHALVSLRRYAEAVAEFDAALRGRPGDAHLLAARAAVADDWYRRGNELRAAGQVEPAIVAYREAVRVNPDHANSRLELGRTLRRAGQMSEAAAVLREAVRLRPEDGWFRQALAWALLGQEHWGEAASAYREAIRLGRGGDADAHLELGNALQAQGEHAAAEAAYGEAIRLKPDYAMAHNNLGNTLRAQGKLEAAEAALREATRLKPDLALAHHNLGHALEAQNKLAEAIVAYESALRHDRGQDASLRSRLAQCCNNRAWQLANADPIVRDPTRAVALARRAAELEPDSNHNLNTLGVALYRDGHHAEAVTTLEKSLAAGRGTSDAFDLFFLAMAHHRLGQPEWARREFDQAVRWWREHPQQIPQWTEELQTFQAEAEAVLAGPAGELPADVFAPAPASGR